MFVASNQRALTPAARVYFFGDVSHVLVMFDMTSDKGGGSHGHHVCVRSVLGSLLYIPSDDILTTMTTAAGSDDDNDGAGAMATAR